MEIDVIFLAANLTKTFKILIPFALLGISRGKKCSNYLHHKSRPLPDHFRTPHYLPNKEKPPSDWSELGGSGWSVPGPLVDEVFVR